MAKILVVYYSRTGHTRKIAQEIARRCGADTEEIRDTKSRAGLWGYLRSAREAMRKRLAPIEPTTAEPSRYDLVVLGSPNWASHMAAPVRSYLDAHARTLGRVAFFCTQGGSGAPKVLGELGALCHRDPIATLVLNEADIAKARYAPRLEEFVAAIAATG
jgi:flavodoxin